MDEVAVKLGEIVKWQKDHEKHYELRFMAIEVAAREQAAAIAKLPTKEEMENIIKETMIESVFHVGRVAKISIVTVATVIGAIMVIGGGFKWLLGLFGIGYIAR